MEYGHVEKRVHREAYDSKKTGSEVNETDHSKSNVMENKTSYEGTEVAQQEGTRVLQPRIFVDTLSITSTRRDAARDVQGPPLIMRAASLPQLPPPPAPGAPGAPPLDSADLIGDRI